MRDIKKELEGYEEYYNHLMHLCHLTRIGLDAELLIAQIKNDDDPILRLLCYIELRRNQFIPRKILNDVKEFPGKEDEE